MSLHWVLDCGLDGFSSAGVEVFEMHAGYLTWRAIFGHD